MQILLATSNPNKLREVRQILAPLGIEVVGLDSVGPLPPEPVEDADSFEGNARIKALAYAAATQYRCLAEDSGLEVDVLDGAPGVHSARYAGVEGGREERDQANNLQLLQDLANFPVSERVARFVCCMCLADPDGSVVAETRGIYEGIITDEPRGDNGFGYDPLLLIPELGQTSAELPSEEKNARSHRGAAARALAKTLESHAPH